MFFFITFIKNVVIICLFSFSHSLIKFVSKFYVGLLVNVSGILSESFHVILHGLAMSRVHQSFFGWMLDFGDFLMEGEQEL